MKQLIKSNNFEFNYLIENKLFSDDSEANCDIEFMIAYQYYEKGEWQQAYEAFKRIMVKQSNNPDIYPFLSYLSFKLQYLNEVHEYWLIPFLNAKVPFLSNQFDQLLQHHNDELFKFFQKTCDNNANALLVVSIFYYMYDRFEDSILSLNKLEPESNDMLFWRNLVLSLSHYELTQNIEFSLSLLKQIDGIFPNNHYLLFVYGKLLKKAGRMKESIQYFKKAIKVNPTAYSYSEIADQYYKAKEFQIAKVWYIKGIELGNTRHNTPCFLDYLNLGDIYEKEKDYRTALKYYLKALQMSTDSFIYITLTNFYFKQNKDDKANYYCTKGLAIYPEDDCLYYQKAEILFDKQQYDDALFNIEKAIEINPGWVIYYELCGDILKRLNQNLESIKAFEKAIALNMESYRAYMGLGSNYYALNRTQDAIENYTKAIILEPFNEKAYYLLSIIYFDTGKYNEALNLITSFLDKKPDDYLGKKIAGDCYKRLEQHEKAIQYYSEIVDVQDFYKNEVVANLIVEYYHIDKPQESKKLLLKLIQEEHDNYLVHLHFIQTCFFSNDFNNIMDSICAFANAPEEYVHQLIEFIDIFKSEHPKMVQLVKSSIIKNEYNKFKKLLNK